MSGRTRTGGVPPLVLVSAGVAAAFLVLPFLAIASEAPWSTLVERYREPAVVDALGLSLAASLAAAGISVLLGVPLAWVLARSRFPGRSVLRGLVLLPMVLTPVVAGTGLLSAFGRRRPLGRWLEDLGVVIPFSAAGVVVAVTFVALPFMVVTVEAGLRAVDPRFEEAAATLGAGRWLRFRRVTVPAIAPAMVAGAVLCWARALGEFGATITFNRNLPGETQTVPLAVFVALESDRDAAVALSLLLVIVAAGAVTLLAVLRDRWLPRRGSP
ncbi:ABC transporter permease [soil metagenome]